MKAWLVREKDEFCAEVVFAETRGKARALAKRADCCEDAKFTDKRTIQDAVSGKNWGFLPQPPKGE